MQKVTKTKKNKVTIKRGTLRVNRRTLPAVKRNGLWKIQVDKWLGEFDAILVKIAVSALLVYEVAAFVAEKTQ